MQPFQQPVQGGRLKPLCSCRRCITVRGDTINGLPRLMCEFIVCPTCGDKRCVQADDHSAPCAKADIYAHNAWVARRLQDTHPEAIPAETGTPGALAPGSEPAAAAGLTAGTTVADVSALQVAAYDAGEVDGESVKIEGARQRDGSTLWAVRRNSNCLASDGQWEYEPLPSGRDAEFLARCRFATPQLALDALNASRSPRD